MDALWISLGIVFLAELGDKSQIVALSFASRQRLVPVLIGFALAQSAVMGISVMAGGAIGTALPDTVVGVAAALAFFGFALWTLWDRGGEYGEPERTHRAGRLVVVTVAVGVFIAELGDKTMLAAATLATRQELLWTWVGAMIGVVAAGSVAIVVGNVMGARLSRRLVRHLAAALFAVFGVLLLADTLWRS